VSCRYVEAIDQGTSSTRFIIFDESTRIVAEAQREHEHEQIGQRRQLTFYCP
jgi:glycerol kinase